MSDTTPPSPPASPAPDEATSGGAGADHPSDPVRVRKVSVGKWDNNVYVIESLGEALIVDGAAEPQRILQGVASLEVKGILQTHNHPDHTGALPALVDSLGVPVFAHPEDPMPVPTAPLTDGQVLGVGDAKVTVLHTPGHTPGSASFHVGDNLFTGDTLFPGGPGSTDHDPVRFMQIMESLRRLFELADDTRVCPGHGLATTIGRERPFLGVWHARGW
jgi:glyoxylase-like metal-dependent hydrolase (beta-lactamase superfamily II)